ncbi:MAG TPA: hypothetical protein VKQ10_07615 [Spirochaetota bacterium]|nr:hypothetical protein [Spirochaetota bacterium]
MKNKKLHSAWCIVFLAAMLLAVPCWSQQDTVTPPEEPASPAVEEVKDVDVDKPEAETTVKPDRDVNAAESREKTVKESTSVKKDAPGTPKKAPGDEASQVKEVKKKAEEPVSSSPSRKDDAVVDEGRLLSITDGPFKYRRISGIQLDEAKAESEQLMADTDSEPEVKKEDNQARGLFGMDKETTDIVAWLILGLIILLVFILYRVRARERPGRVLRRFPRV